MEDTKRANRRRFLDVLLGASVAGWVASIVYPIMRYLKPLPLTGATGPARLTPEQVSKLETDRFVIVPVSGQRVIVLESATQELLAFSAICTHEGCTVTYQPGQSVIWCPCHDARFDLNGRVVSGPPPRPLPRFAATRQADGSILVSVETS